MAVYTEVADEELAAFVARFGIGELLAAKGIAEGVENSNYFIHTSEGFFILTLYEKRVSEADLPFFLGLMEHLSGKGLVCPRPVTDRHGEALGRLAGRPAAIVTFLDGISVKRPSVAHCRSLGEALARLHKGGADFHPVRHNALSVEGWRPLFAAAAARADGVRQGLASQIEAALTQLEREWPKNLPKGNIHADLFPDNVFFIGEEVSGVIDFYFACTDALSYDLAVCLNAWCFEPDNSFNLTKGQALLSGYQRLRSLTSAEIEALPLLARGAALRFLLTRLVDWLNVPPGALVKPKDPLEYLRKLRFHARVASAAEYGLSA
ncbi:MAG: homoserine kinase [Hyphomicrobiales bacterium]|nr:homoserine kinase [Hyphomicrobiales bacterium]